jgi:hypothetical protein
VTLRDSPDRAVLRVICLDKVSHFLKMRASANPGRVQLLQSESRTACHVAYGGGGLCTPHAVNVCVFACTYFLQTCDISATHPAPVELLELAQGVSQHGYHWEAGVEGKRRAFVAVTHLIGYPDSNTGRSISSVVWSSCSILKSSGAAPPR